MKTSIRARETCGASAHYRTVGPRNRLFSAVGRRGAALMFALVAILILSVLILGITTLTAQHYSLAHAQLDHTAAFDTAETGLHYELGKMTGRENGTGAVVDNGRDARYTGEITLTNVFNEDEDPPNDPNNGIAETWVTAIDGVSLWQAPGPFMLHSNGIIPQQGGAPELTRGITAK